MGGGIDVKEPNVLPLEKEHPAGKGRIDLAKHSAENLEREGKESRSRCRTCESCENGWEP